MSFNNQFTPLAASTSASISANAGSAKRSSSTSSSGKTVRQTASQLSTAASKKANAVYRVANKRHLKIGFVGRMRRKALLEGDLERRLRPGSPLFRKRQEVVKWYINKQLEIYLMYNV